MKFLNHSALFGGLLLIVGLTLHADAKPPVTFLSPCECQGNHGVSRWAAKTDLEEPPANSAAIKGTTPSQIKAWPGPGGKISHSADRIAAENQWYAVSGRIEKIKIEDDGDIHIVLRDVNEATSGMVVELPLGPRWCEMRKIVFSWTTVRFPISPGNSGKLRLVQHPVVTVTGKALYDIDHSGNDNRSNRRDYDRSLAVWEIHPAMNLVVDKNESSQPAPANKALPEISAATTPTPQSANAHREFVTITRPIAIQVPYGTTVLQPGTKLPVLSRDSQNVDVRYLDARYSIPISYTDWR